MRRIQWLITLALIAATLTGALKVQAQSPASQYFPQTGHSVQDDFLRFFNTRGGLEIFGYPLTEAFVENGRLVQYFQKVKLEAHPENPDLRKIELGSLGIQLGYAAPPIPAAEIPPTNDPNRRYYPETGHTVVYAFRIYFDAHGGPAIFGYPITEFERENGRFVQYFQRARMEWHPELPSDKRVQVGNLGEIYATTQLSPDLRDPPPGILATTGVVQITELRAIASLRYAITGQSGQQILHVYVLDQRGNPVQGAAAVAVVRLPYGDLIRTPEPTDANGYTQTAFEFGNLNPGYSVVVQVRASWATLVTETQTSFFVWW